MLAMINYIYYYNKLYRILLYPFISSCSLSKKRTGLKIQRHNYIIR